ncbi:sensor histidine kinase [Marinospirillum insulare]|uniref:histidine kinase n=1 Tax=Marinospirillum insulare TaxID=217169 RepID=A0ABQ5ZZ52_9GAMM|nr:sensor histidine kinase [Marinospirillum insulare]GLR64305.1 sodium:solute symporter [Marinospirillum insulare]
MRTEWVSLAVGFSYLGILFLIAAWGDKRSIQGRSIINSPLVYALSIAVYCTAWTFYGSVGRAAETGLSFLLVYLGPTLAMLLGWFMIRKMIRISRAQKITSIADFISARYGKSTRLGVLVTLIAVIGVMPYIALQLKAITISHALLTGYPLEPTQALATKAFLFDKSFWVAIVLAVFIILFGTRHLDASERHEGMVAAIAFESIVKLLAFLAAGIFVVFWLYQGPMDLFEQAASRTDLVGTLGLDAVPGGAVGWVGTLILSTLAFITLPRQFQVLVIENVDERHVKRAGWIFPLYLFAINIMVIPIALAGLLMGDGSPDDYVLTLPLAAGLDALPLFVFIGGLSAATGMVIVETIALSTMVSNHLVMPVLLRWKWLHLDPALNLSGWLLGIRRVAILLILLLGYLYHALIGESYTLVTTGLVSFAAASQFAPALLLGLYWRGGNAKGTAAGLVGGFIVWGYTLLLPGFALSGWLDSSLINQGPWGIAWLKPYALFGLEGWDIYAHALFWSLLVNIGLLVGVSLFSRQSNLEQTQAALFTEALRPDVMQTPLWLGQTTKGELYQLANRYLGKVATLKIFTQLGSTESPSAADDTPASPTLIAHTEKALTGALGSASARVLINSVVRGEALDIEAVLSILDTTSQALEYNKRLEQKSTELAQIGEELRGANVRLRELDKLKDEFVAMVSHELRTPLTSIRAFAEILRDSPEVSPEQKSHFLDVIVKESERLSRLIEEILDLARLESGRMRLDLKPVNLSELAKDSADAITQLYDDRQVALKLLLPAEEAWVKADPDRLQQVVINLLDNASKFTSPEDARVVMTISSKTNRWLLAVEDNGTGIVTEERDKVFEKFHQIQQHKDASGSRPKGSGLGLPISRGIITHHQGLLYAEAGQVLKGARFVIELPTIQP